jgi:hypothetical protein
MDLLKQRIAIAKALGIQPITKCGWCVDGIIGTETDHYRCGQCKGTGLIEPYYDCPDYLNDLDAMHEVEKKISGREDEATYRTCLEKLRGWDFWKASAAQRAEAFLRTLDLWEE